MKRGGISFDGIRDTTLRVSDIGLSSEHQLKESMVSFHQRQLLFSAYAESLGSEFTCSRHLCRSFGSISWIWSVYAEQDSA
jgi:hypothetical protein